ncbi:NlpC/P60 family protein [Demequina litorisediminis]|uniref:NlpC/P60 domain-containing protein n=1 Tax=Demequina litorisediminis TaxID=1849022 RepID=A0ABQ6IBU9_9MICO|nr:NlpC/P60 family protein [Demequina litorisediminis]GMA35186.1 hypothetical protein GCM10025876_13900 [Demequina litorisediminis]
MQSYKNAGSMGSLEAITQAGGFDDVIARTEAVNQASAKADVTVQEVSAAELVATTTREYAETAAVKAKEAEQTAEGALTDAKAARTSAEQAVSSVAIARDAAVTRLATLRGVSEDLERERQAGLTAEREARAQAEFEAKAEREENAQQVDNMVGDDDSSTPRPTSTKTSTPKPTSTDTSEPQPTSTKTSTPKPTSTKTSEPEPTSTKTSEPKPTQTSTPDPDPSWSSSASQGAKAVAHALTLQGHPYSQTLDGGTGPTYYDCSGLVQEAWQVAGKYIPRTSRSQYDATTHLPISQARPGDLVFWSSNGSGSGVYHVAIYIGNGQVMEARRPGVESQVGSMYRGGSYNLMPVVGRV